MALKRVLCLSMQNRSFDWLIVMQALPVNGQPKELLNADFDSQILLKNAHKKVKIMET